MNQSHYIFIAQLIAAINGNKPFFVSKKNNASGQLAPVFASLNIIKKTTPISHKLLRNMPKLYRKNYIVYWLKYGSDNSRGYAKIMTSGITPVKNRKINSD